MYIPMVVHALLPQSERVNQRAARLDTNSGWNESTNGLPASTAGQGWDTRTPRPPRKMSGGGALQAVSAPAAMCQAPAAAVAACAGSHDRAHGVRRQGQPRPAALTACAGRDSHGRPRSRRACRDCHGRPRSRRLQGQPPHALALLVLALALVQVVQLSSQLVSQLLQGRARVGGGQVSSRQGSSRGGAPNETRHTNITTALGPRFLGPPFPCLAPSLFWPLHSSPPPPTHTHTHTQKKRPTAPSRTLCSAEGSCSWSAGAARVSGMRQGCSSPLPSLVARASIASRASLRCSVCGRSGRWVSRRVDCVESAGEPIRGSVKESIGRSSSAPIKPAARPSVCPSVGQAVCQ
jgi:hypothetical protein